MTKTITATIRDAKGQTARVECNLPTGTGHLVATTFAQDYFAASVANISSGQLIALSITDNLDLPEGIATSPDPSSDVEEGALFIFRTEGNHFTKIRIPGLYEGMILPGTDTVDLTDADVDAFVDSMIDGLEDVVNGDALPSDSRDEDIIAVSSAKEDFRPR